jgi:hypothetical protein
MCGASIYNLHGSDRKRLTEFQLHLYALLYLLHIVFGMHHTYGQWESASKMTMFVLYCIAYYKYISVIAEKYFKVNEGFNFYFEN